MATIVACSPSEKQEKERFRLFWPNSKGDYGFKDIKVHGLKNKNEVRGNHLRVYVNPRVEGDKVIGDRPSAKFVRSKKGVNVPADALSHQMVAAFAHVNRLKKLSSKWLSKKITSPNFILFHKNFSGGDGRKSRNNAHFVSSLDSMVLVPQTKKSKIPTALNAGVIAHEFFHSIFAETIGKLHEEYEKISGFIVWPKENLDSTESDTLVEEYIETEIDDEVLDQIKPDPRDFDPNDLEIRKMNSLMLSSMNEGFADIWGWIYSGDTNYFEKSFPHQSTQRQIKIANRGLIGHGSHLHLVRNFQLRELKTSWYTSGNRYANLVFSVADLYQKGKLLIDDESTKSWKETQVFVASWILETLKDISKEAAIHAQMGKMELFSDGALLYSLLAKLNEEKASESLCKILVGGETFFLNDFPSELDEQCSSVARRVSRRPGRGS